MTRFLPFLVILAIPSLFCSCASVKVHEVHRASSVRAPRTVYVAPFSLEDANLKEHPMRKHPGKLGAEAQALLSKYLVQELSEHLAPAKVVSPSARAPRDGWLVTGRFTRINEGSRILRMAIGLGAGGTKMETRVAVSSSGRREPFLRFGTTGGSGATPGAATNPIPFSSAPTAALQSRLGVTDDAARTARVITNELLTYLGREPKAGVRVGRR